MNVLCFFGIHKFRVENVQPFTRRRDFDALVWGNAEVRERCVRCQRVRYSVRFVRP